MAESNFSGVPWPPQLHVYGPPFQHADVFIVADRAGLHLLRDACEVILQNKASECAFEAYTADGEGFALFVAELQVTDRRWQQLALPYIDSEVYNPPKEALGPVAVFGTERYKELHRKLRESNP